MARLAFFIVDLLITATSSAAQEYVYSGPWKTTNRKLDGVMTAVVTAKADQKWEGRFYGTWQGVDFDYRVTFQGPPDDVHGIATIDGAIYDWRGRIDAQGFRANFTGDRYEGSFALKRTKLPAPAAQ